MSEQKHSARIPMRILSEEYFTKVDGEWVPDSELTLGGWKKSKKSQSEIITENLVGFSIPTAFFGLCSAGGFFGRTGHWVVGIIFGLLFLGMLAIMVMGIVKLIRAKKSES